MIDEDCPGFPQIPGDGEAKATSVFQPQQGDKVDTATPLTVAITVDQCGGRLQQPRQIRGRRCRQVTVLTHRQESRVKQACCRVEEKRELVFWGMVARERVDR